MTTTRILVAVAAVLAAPALGIVVWRATCATCGQQEVLDYAPAPHLSDEDNAKSKKMWDDVYKRAAETGSVAQSQITELESYLEPTQPYHVRSLAMAVMAELVHMEVEMSEASKERIVQNFLVMLRDDEWGLRVAAVTNVHTVDLLRDPRIYEAVRALEDDPRQEVANRVNMIDWDDPSNGG